MLQIVTPSDLSPELTALYQSGLPAGTRTGWDSLDTLYTVSPGYWTVVTGIPSHGKSTWVDNLVLNLIRRGWKAIIYSPEQQPVELHMSLMVEKWLNRPFRYGYNARIDPSGLAEAVDALDGSLRILRHDGGAIWPSMNSYQLAVDEIVHGAWKDEQKIVCVLDPWNELDHAPVSGMNETQMTNHELMLYRMWIRNSKRLHGVIVTHPAKPQKDKNGNWKDVGLYDINGSAAWKNKCDHGIIVIRREEHTEVNVEKCRFRHLGKQGIAQLDFYSGTGVYRDPESRARSNRRFVENAND